MWGSVISIGASLLGSAMQGDAAESAAGAQGQAGAGSIAEQRRQFDFNRKDSAPWRDIGGAAIKRLGLLMGLDTPSTRVLPDGRTVEQAAKDLWDQEWNDDVGGLKSRGNANRSTYEAVDPGGYSSIIDSYIKRVMPQSSLNTGAGGFGDLTRKFTLADFEGDPVIQKSFDFGLSEGQKAVQRMFGARGMSRSGAAIKAATRFATDYTGQQAGASRDRFIQDQDKVFNRLSGVSGSGQTATQNVMDTNSRISGGISNTLEGIGNARGAAAIARGNAAAGTLNSIGNNAQRFFTMTTPPINPNGPSIYSPAASERFSYLPEFG